MKKKVVWLVVTGWVVAALLLASCAPAVVKEKEAEKIAPKEEVTTPKEEVVPREVVAPETKLVKDALGQLVEPPKYGGTLILASDEDLGGFDRTNLWATRPPGYIFPTNETLILYDELIGLGGSKERSANYNLWDTTQLVPGLAERWEVIEPNTLKFRIRKGVRFHDRPPVNGAEVTPEDVLWSLRMPWMSIGRYPKAYPYLENNFNAEESIYLDPDDRRVIVVKTDPDNVAMALRRVGHQLPVMPKVLDQSPSGYADDHFRGAFRRVIGTGPFMPKDHVWASSYIWERNPNYWGTDPFHPQNRLPYIDSMTLLVIPDKSTRMAAFRVGKTDIFISARWPELNWEEYEQFKRTNPNVQWRKVLSGGDSIHVRHDVAPFGDVRVRQALMMAIDHDEIVKNYYRGEAEKFYTLVWPIPDHVAYWVPWEEMPKIVQEMYEYHPDKAKRLLAEAGYPDGFRFSVIVTSPDEIDKASIVKHYWQKVGIDLKIEVRDSTVFTSMTRNRTFKDAAWGNPLESYYVTYSAYYSPRTTTNRSVINERWIDDIVEASFAAAYLKPDQHVRLTRDAIPKLEEFAPFVRLPLRYAYIPWHPWVKGYHGEIYGPSYGADRVFTRGKYIWIDQKLKEQLTSKR